jgi:hypothetical protein
MLSEAALKAAPADDRARSAEEEGAGVAGTPALLPAPPSPPLPLVAHDPAAAARRIAELERKIGQQSLDLDFFRAALRHVRALCR